MKETLEQDFLKRNVYIVSFELIYMLSVFKTLCY